MKIRTVFRLTPRLGKTIKAILAMRAQEPQDTRKHLELCAGWLLAIQEPAGGYMASYGLVTGRRHAYIETTGYIIPTMFDLAARLEDSRCRESALRAGEWLLSVQQPDGAYTDIDEHLPQVFDTGQVMLGLNRLFRETQDLRYREATRRAADWLVSVQDSDGSWTRASYRRGDPYVYMSRVAAAMIESAQLTGEVRHHAAAIAFLRWAAAQQLPNGFFRHCELIPGADPVLHTMMYVLEGFLMAHQLTGDREWLDVVLRGAQPLLDLHLHRDLVPRSQYDAEWRVTNSEKCLTGIAQWAGLCLDLNRITGEPDWLEAASLSLYYLKSKQMLGGGILHGALPASIPIWGYYHPMMFPNWGVKFFADALLLYGKYGLEVWQEQETWVKRCFELQMDGGGWSHHSRKLEPLDEIICADIAEALRTLKAGATVLDLGCGEGRYQAHLGRQFPALTFIGVDPGVATDTPGMRRGSACQIPLPDGSVEAVYTWCTLQHVADLPRALREIRRVLKPGGRLVIGDRNKWSARGLMKPWHELRGRWMYPWDSPFRERWYSPKEWQHMIQAVGFQSPTARTYHSSGNRGVRRLIPVNRFCVLHAVAAYEPRKPETNIAMNRQGRAVFTDEEKSSFESELKSSRYSARWWLEQLNWFLSPLNIRLDTLTTAHQERRRLEALRDRGCFDVAAYPVPECFKTAASTAILESQARFRTRFDSFTDASRNDVGYQFDNHYYDSPDAEVLYTILRLKKPARVLEIGCGNSTKIIRQAVRDGGFPCELTSIDPFPREEIAALSDRFIRAPIEAQDAGQLADGLNAGDILFIDTSHEVRVGNDLAFIFGNLIPRLKPGVIVHIHDIFLPWEYPSHWVFDLHITTWGEQYLVHAMLAGSDRWGCLWPGYYLQRTLQNFGEYFPHCHHHLAQSLWLIRM